MCFCRYFVSLSQVRYEHPYQKREAFGSLFFGAEKGAGLEQFKCGADERRSRGLDRATH